MAKLPEFLNKEYIEKVLQKHENDPTILVQDLKSEPAVAAGNNYASLLLRCHIKYSKKGKNHEKSLIIKTVVADPEMAKMIVENGIYQKEMIMYSRILPKFQKLLTEAGDDEKLYSPAVHVDVDRCTLIFEDLKEQGFTTADRLTGVDEKHLELLIRKIAKFHACSMVLAENGSEDYKEFQGSPFKDDVAEKFVFGMYDAFLSQAKTWKGFEKYAIKLEKLKKNLLTQVNEMFTGTKYPIKVLAHGDLWVNNMMFRYNDDKIPNDLVLIDFQVSYIGAGVIDLMYFTQTSTRLDIKLHKFLEILTKYYANLVQCLKQLQYKGKMPTMFELYCQYIEKSFYEIFAIILVSPIMLNEQQENADLGGLMSDTENAKQFREQMYKSEKFIKTIQHFCPIWDKMGLLDPLH